MPDTIDESFVEKLDLSSKIESIASIVLAIAVVLTAWAAFQAGKWGGEQSIQFSVAGASRTESTRADTRGGQLAQIDVSMYTDFVAAYANHELPTVPYETDHPDRLVVAAYKAEE